MDISYKWLKRYIAIDLPPRELAAVLTSLGLECDTVEEVESVRGGLRGLVTGKVLTCEEHPNSDHLHITTVDLGDGQPTQIVCGAPNVAAGQSVIVAPVGCTLYDGDKEFQIKKSKIRGVESFGMICAEDEIGIGTSHDGIMVLPETVKPGIPAAEYFNLQSDWRLEVDLTPNRVDAASHYGVARDLKAHIARNDFEHQGQAEPPVVSLPDTSALHPDRMDGAVKVTVEDTEGCLRYSGVTLRGVKVTESPEWLRDLLTAAGQRPINNIVDITNFILLGLGQPLHCFDLAKVAGEEIVVRTCPEGTTFVTLDGTERKLSEADLMICDADKPMCIAGVFGGLDSGVTESTTDVFIESAYFNPTRVRRTARRHGLSTDASFRYERGTDPNITVYAARLAATLIKELAGGEMCGDVSDFYPVPVKDAEMDFSLDYCAHLIGKRLPKELVVCILRALEIDVQPTDDQEVLYLRVPAYRVDVTRPCDVVEEILRVYGYNNVEFGTEMHANLSQRGRTDEVNALQTLVSEQLTGQGFSEILNNSLTSAGYYADGTAFPAERCVRLLNPLSNELSVMRQTLLFGGLEVISHNVRRKVADLRLYEFGNVYSFDPAVNATEEKPLTPYSERFMLGLWLTGDYTQPSWNSKAVEATFYDLRAVTDNIMARMGVPASAVAAVQGSDDLLGAMLTLTSRDGKEIGRIGIVARKVLKAFDIEQDVVCAELGFDVLCRLAARTKVTFTDLPRTQPVRRDLALLIDKNTAFADIDRTVRKAAGKMLRSLTLFDVYEGERLPEGKKSYAIALTLQDDEKTLTDKQIDAVMHKVTEALAKSIGAELR